MCYNPNISELIGIKIATLDAWYFSKYKAFVVFVPKKIFHTSQSTIRSYKDDKNFFQFFALFFGADLFFKNHKS